MAIRTVPDGTEDADLFTDIDGSDLPGFSSGNALVLEPATIVSHYVMNHQQEELCRAAEGSGQSVTEYANSAAAQAAHVAGTMNYDQLDIAIRQVHEVAPSEGAASCILNGLRLNSSGASLVVQVEPGEFIISGRKYFVTQAKLDAAGFDEFTLPASRDSYFFIAPYPAGLPSERTVYITTLDVAVGAAAPATPAGTFRFARATTNGSGITSTIYFVNGPIMMNQNGVGMRLKPPDNAGVSGALIPHPSTSIGLSVGQEEDDEQPTTPLVGSFINNIVFRQSAMRSDTWAAAHPLAMSRSFTRQTITTSSDGRLDLYDEDDFNDGTVIKFDVHAVAYDAADATDSYAGHYRAMVIRDGGAFSLQGSGALVWEDGDGALAAGVSITMSIVGGEIGINLLHHTGNDSLRWHVRIDVEMNGPTPP